MRSRISSPWDVPEPRDLLSTEDRAALDVWDRRTLPLVAVIAIMLVPLITIPVLGPLPVLGLAALGILAVLVIRRSLHNHPAVPPALGRLRDAEEQVKRLHWAVRAAKKRGETVEGVRPRHLVVLTRRTGTDVR